MDSTSKPPPYYTSDQSSFAYVSAKDRWPVILTGAIDDVHRVSMASSEPETQAEGKSIVAEIGKLKYEMQHDRTLTPIPEDGHSDTAAYNDELATLGYPTWFNIPWLYAECYMYRRMSSIFVRSKRWKNHDVFARQKQSAFRSSRPAVMELAGRYNEVMAQLDSKKSSHTGRTPEEDTEAELLLFKEMCEICLWGNATDLSLLTSLTYDDIQKLQGSEARKKAEKNIIVDELPAAFDVLKKAQRTAPNKERRVDIILDNSGFELFVDLVLAGYLLVANLATTVILHPKSIPWFVSDVLPADFATLMNALVDPQSFFRTSRDDTRQDGPEPEPLSDRNLDDISSLFTRWSEFHQNGQLIIRPNRFWTQAGGYDRLATADPRLFEDLRGSELVIFKGDLNYRKLTGDLMWDPTTPFPQTLGSLGIGSGVRTLALRTCKADVVVGLPPGEDEKLRAMENGGGESGQRRWAWSGKWAVVQLCDGKQGPELAGQ